MRKFGTLGAAATAMVLGAYAAPSAAQNYSAWALCYQYSYVDSTLYMSGIFRSDLDRIVLALKFSDIVARQTGVRAPMGTHCEKNDDGNVLNSLRYDIKQNHKDAAFQELSPPR